MLVNVEFVKSLGFVKDITAPINVNRWVNCDRQNHYISITFNEDGTNTIYGVFIKKDGLYLQPIKKVTFDKKRITQEDFYLYMEKCNIKLQLRNKFNKMY